MLREELSARLTLKLSAASQEIVPGVWTTGEISERTEFEGRGKAHRMVSEGQLVVDAYRDDMALVLQIDDRLTLLCGCCHAGLLNTLEHVERVFAQPVVQIVGGLHLAGVTEDDLHRATARLAAMPALQRIAPCHCTGEAALLTLAQTLGANLVRSSPAGTAIEIGNNQ